MKIDRAAVAAALRLEDLDTRYGLGLRGRGRWRRTRRCPRGDHAAALVAVSVDGRWRCHSHCEGGDLLQMVGAFEGLEHASDLPKLLEIAAEIAGLTESDFGGSAPPPRRPPVPTEPLGERVARAHERAAWLWSRAAPLAQGGDVAIAEIDYVRSRGLDPAALRAAGELRLGPVLLGEREATEIGGARSDGGAPNLAPIWTIYRGWVEDGFGVIAPVCHVDDGRVVDVRIRRVRPRRDDSPKIQGMLGGCASHDGDLVGCYGHPHMAGIEGTATAAIVCEGLFDYLTLRTAAPAAWVLGAVDAGQYPKVAAHAAAWCAETGTPLVLVAQEDGPGGAAVRAVDAAAVEAIHLGVTPAYVECGALGGKDASAVWQRSPNKVRRAIAEAAASTKERA